MIIYIYMALVAYNVYISIQCLKDNNGVEFNDIDITTRAMCIPLSMMGIPYPFMPIIGLFYNKKEMLEFMGEESGE